MRFPHRSALLALFASASVALTGCGLGSLTSTSSSSLAATSGAMLGDVHGGQQPVSNSSVQLFSAGTTGYGTGSTLLATSAATDTGGHFSFTKLGTTGGVISSSGPIWQCPATGDPLIYITATGGNPTGNGDSSVNNAAIEMMAALGPCSTVSSSTFVSLNEITTAASVFALSQYIYPGSGAGTFTLGAPNTTQAQLGLKNAAANLANLTNIATGQTIAPPVYTNASGVGLGTVAVTATAEAAKLNTIANILAACVNTTSASSSICTDLFTHALPPQSATYTSQPGATFATATDTLQAAYYMATNPASLGTFTTCTSNSSATTTMGCLFTLPTSTAPFAGGLTTQPSDWTLGVTYTASGSCSGGGAFFAGPTKTSVDASGNIWILNGASSSSASNTYANLVELSPTGQPMLCLGASSNGRGLTIDPTGNVWASFNTTGTSGGIQELPAGSSALVSWPTTVGGTAYTPYTVTSDGTGNIYFTNIGTGGQLLQFAAPLTNTTPTTATLLTAGSSGYNGTSSTTTNYTAVDPQNRIWVATSSTSGVFESVYAASSTTATVTSYSISYSSGSYATVTFQAANSFTAGQRITVAGLTGAGTAAGLNGTFSVLPGVSSTSFQVLIPYTSSLASTTDSGVATAQTYGFGKTATPTTAYGLAIDSNNYAYQGTTCCGTGTTSYKELIKVTPGSNGTGTVSASPQYLGGINGVRAVALDGAANVWVGNLYSSTGNLSSTTNFPIAEIATSGSGTTATFTALSPTGSITTANCSTTLGCPTGGGFLKADFQEVRDLAVDPSGNVWVLNTGNETTSSSTYTGTTVTQIVGAAVPTVTPLSVAAATGKLASKP